MNKSKFLLKANVHDVLMTHKQTSGAPGALFERTRGRASVLHTASGRLATQRDQQWAPGAAATPPCAKTVYLN